MASCFESIPKITALSPEATAVPLICVLAATGIKDAADDIKRHKSDRAVNNRKANILTDNGPKEKNWMDLQVGEVLRIDNNEQIPADIVVLTTSEDNGLCYIETAELDGETNLKCRQPLPETGELGDDEQQLSVVQMEITCDPPNNRLEKLNGRLMYDGNNYSLDNDNVILRGCVLRNTKWVYGVVIYAGHDTKLMMNTGVSKFKRTGLDKLTNSLILWDFQVYLPWESFYKDSVVIIGIVHWPSFVMVLNTLIPISLYISVEVIRLGQSLWINWDCSMYYEKMDTPAVARTTTLSEELGQIEYIFSDKTGTLTQNVMTFKKCSINGRLYGHVEGESAGDPEETLVSSVSIREEGAPDVDLSKNPYPDGKFKFNDQALLDEINLGNKECHELFRLLAVCHTVMVERDNGNLEYQAQSPDEAALVTAARNFGFTFLERSPTTLTIDVLREEEIYELLAILDFNNERKRMSVIVRRNDQIKLYCKGAEALLLWLRDLFVRNGTVLFIMNMISSLNSSVQGEENLDLRTVCLSDTIVYELLDQSCKPLMTKTMQHLNAYEEIEQNLTLIGATAIEDKLQDDVPDTIATLAEANIKIWVLTGDKVETAINIGYSCHLLTDDMTEVFTIDGESLESVQKAIAECKNKITGGAGLGAPICRFQSKENSLKDVEVEVISYKDNYLGEKSAAVQALVVHLVKDNLQAVTLAIGDGANDTLYDAWFISFYNVFFTSAPVVFLAVLDQDVSDNGCSKYPLLYIPGQTNLLFNKKIFFLSLLYGALTSLAIFFLSYGAFRDEIVKDGLETSSVYFFGTVVAAILVVVVNIEISFLTQYWTWINHFFTWGSIVFYFVFYFVFYAEFVFKLFPQGHYYGMQFEVYGNPKFWFTLFLVLAVSTAPRLSYYFVDNEMSATQSDIVRRKEAHKRMRFTSPQVEYEPQLVRRRTSKRSSYAFAHQEGFGKIVMSPATFLRKKLRSTTQPAGQSSVVTL
ncbi:putative phospholipid-transporting ATPase ID [Stylophora pistillata]|uniref:Phospholipid-transporting ATPase n=1 Tax=Stylophora pistillata TaxID=50429 RepID=A0A2B4SNG1_STYPI|nr:putative phospholipid-transporting ATPase ID [Stylophora pistillata]